MYTDPAMQVYIAPTFLEGVIAIIKGILMDNWMKEYPAGGSKDGPIKAVNTILRFQGGGRLSNCGIYLHKAFQEPSYCTAWKE